MAVLNPVKVIIDNYPEDKEEQLEAINNPEDPSQGTRHIPFTRELYIEQEDFMEVPEKKFFRLSPGKEVRLRYAYFIKCTHIVKTDKAILKNPLHMIQRQGGSQIIEKLSTSIEFR